MFPLLTLTILIIGTFIQKYQVSKTCSEIIVATKTLRLEKVAGADVGVLEDGLESHQGAIEVLEKPQSLRAISRSGLARPQSNILKRTTRRPRNLSWTLFESMLKLTKLGHFCLPSLKKPEILLAPYRVFYMHAI